MIFTNSCGELQVVVNLGETVEDIKEQMFRVTLENNSGNRTKTARALGVTLRTVRLWLVKYKLGPHAE